MGRLEGQVFLFLFAGVHARNHIDLLAYMHYTKQKQSNYSAVKTH